MRQKVPSRARKVLLALGEIESEDQRQKIITALDPEIHSSLAKILQEIGNGQGKFSLGVEKASDLRRIFAPNRRRIRRYIESNDRKRLLERKGGGIISGLLAFLVPLIIERLVRK